MMTISDEHQQFHLRAEEKDRATARDAFRRAGYDTTSATYLYGLHVDKRADAHHVVALGYATMECCREDA